jgi:hypothetical protein
MKKIVLIVTICMFFFTVCSTAQITIPVSKTITVDAYAGMLGWTSLPIDYLGASCQANVRLGAIAVYRPAPWFAAKGTGAYNIAADGKTWSMQQVGAIFTPTNGLNITMGNNCTLVTEQRPSPATSGGQFETFTESKIPGMALNVKAVWDLKNVSFGAGVADRLNNPEYQLMFRFKNIKLSGFYDMCDYTYGGVLTAEIGRITDIVVYHQQQIISNLFMFHAGRDRNWCLYSDTGWDLYKNKLVRGEWGALRTFSGHYIGGLIGPGYCYEDRSFHVYVFVHLDNPKKLDKPK